MEKPRNWFVWFVDELPSLLFLLMFVVTVIVIVTSFSGDRVDDGMSYIGSGLPVR